MLEQRLKDRFGSIFALTSHAVSLSTYRCLPLVFRNQHSALRFVQSLVVSDSSWRQILQSTDHGHKVGSLSKCELEKLIAQLMMARKLWVYSSAQLTLARHIAKSTLNPSSEFSYGLMLGSMRDHAPQARIQAVGDANEARSTLGQLTNDEAFWARVLNIVNESSGPAPVAGNTDTLDSVVGLLLSGKLAVLKLPISSISVSESEEPEPVSDAKPVSVLRPAAPEPEKETPKEVIVEPDTECQIEVLKSAARDGKAFCEECEKQQASA